MLRFLWMFVVGAFAYAGVDVLFDAASVIAGERRNMHTWRLYALGVVLGGFVAGALGWYFDAPQIAVVVNKFWAYADVNYRLSGRPLGDFVTYPIFNKYGMVNLGQVAGGVRLFYAESISGVINWSLAAPLFAVNAVLLTALLDRSLAPVRDLFSGRGAESLVELAVRVMRWGLWMAPIINTFLRQSPHPSWFNQDGAVRTLVASGVDVGFSPSDFRDFSLTIFLGLLAYDWLRVLIWFDHMGLRVATLVNLSFIGGDRVDEAAGRFLGHGARTRAIPDAIRRFGTWAPLLIPFYIPRDGGLGQGLDRRGGARAGAGRCPTRSRRSRSPMESPAPRWRWRRCSSPRARAKSPARRRWPSPGAPASLSDRPHSFAFNNGAVGVDLMRDGRGAANVMADERGGFAIDLIRRPLDPLQARGHFFYLSEEGEAPWSIGYEPARRAGDYRVEQVGFNRLVIANTHPGRARVDGGLAGRRRRDPELAHPPRGSFRPGAPPAPDQLLRNRRPRDRRLCARPRLRRHARRDDLRARPQCDPRAQSPVALGARRSRRDFVLRRQARRRRLARRLRGFAHAFPRRRVARRADGLRTLPLAKTRRRGQAVDLRPRRQLHARSRACGGRPRRRRVRRRTLGQRRLGVAS